MRVVLFIDILGGGGACRSVLTLFETLNQQGVDAHLILIYPIVKIPIENFKDKIHILYETKFEPKIKFKPLRYFLIAKKLLSELNKIGKYNLFISNLQFADHVTRVAKIPNAYYCIRSNMSIDFLKFKRNKLTQSLKRIRLQKFYNNQNIITISKGIEQDILQNLHIKPKSIQTIYNPFDIEKNLILAEEKNEYIPNEEYIIHVGRFHIHQKRQDLLLKAYKKSQVPYKLLLLGQGDDEKLVHQYISELDLNEKVIFAGFHKNPYPFIKNAKLLVLTSDYEGFGRVIVEALGLGRTVISTNCPNGPSEILIDELSNYLARSGDIDDIADKIRYAITNPMKIEKKHYEFFTDKVIAQQYIQLANQN